MTRKMRAMTFDRLVKHATLMDNLAKAGHLIAWSPEVGSMVVESTALKGMAIQCNLGRKAAVEESRVHALEVALAKAIDAVVRARHALGIMSVAVERLSEEIEAAGVAEDKARQVLMPSFEKETSDGS